MLTDWAAWDLFFSVEAVNTNAYLPDAEDQSLITTAYQAFRQLNMYVLLKLYN